MVKKKNRILSTSFREIKNSFPRFISLLIMSFLGVFVFSGLKATSPSMMNSLDKFLKSRTTYDIKLLSPLGFDDSTLEIIKDIDGVEICEESTSYDYKIKGKNDKDYVICVSTITNSLNKVESSYLDELKENEILFEEDFFNKTNYQIGDEIVIEQNDLKFQKFVIKGTVDSSLYFNNAKLNNNRGKTNIGNGTINFYSFVSSSSLKSSLMKNIYIVVKDANKYQTGSDKYLNLVKETKNNIDEKSEVILKNRKDQLNEQINFLENNGKMLIENYNSLNNAINQALKQMNFNSIEEFELYFASLDSSSSLYPSCLMLHNQIETYIQVKEAYDSLEEVLSSYSYTDEEIDLLIDKLKLTLENSKLYIYDRKDNTTYKNYIDDTKSVNNLAYFFPIIFFLVAVLVSLVSMNRMVEDDRLMIGTFKSLGFSSYHILIKYIIFASLSTIIGGILGIFLGVIIIPSLINNMYSLLFTLPKFYISLNLKYSLLGFFISLICILGATLYTVIKEVRNKPSELLRPKSPKKGKKVLLERIPKIWNKLSFSNKVTIRNLSRYKKRVLVTLFGVAGCTSLMLCGFGIKDSITEIPNKQFEYVTTYDANIYFDNADEDKINQLLNDERITDFTKLSLINGDFDKYEVTINVLSDNYSSFQHLYSLSNHQEIPLEDNKVYVSDKLASLNSLKIGDIISFNDNEMNSYTLEVGGIIENYINHYFYISNNTYKNIVHSEPNYNVSYVKLLDLNQEDLLSFQENMLLNDEILNVVFVSDSISQANDMLQTLNKVVVILIVLAALLSFIVLYNLSNINIHERKREIATLKVLGFYTKEVDHYITSENIILTIGGIILGLLFGYFLTNIVVSTVELEYVRFIHHIFILSYVYSSLMALLFTLIINFITHFSLKKINMIESLKSVE